MSKPNNRMQVFVISLPDAHARRAHVTHCLNAANVAFRFFDALTGEQAIKAGEFSSIDEDEFLLNTGRRITDGEIGCFASHRRIWKLCAALRAPVVILEDDFDLVGDLVPAIVAATRLLPTTGFIRLHTDIRGRKHRIWVEGDFELHRFTKPPHGLMAYAINSETARLFVDRTTRLSMPVDVFAKRYWDHGCAMYALLPYAFTHSSHHDASTIRGRRRTRKPISIATRRFVYRCLWQWQRVCFNWRFADCQHDPRPVRVKGALTTTA